jgi:hypothetical protein
LKACPVTNTKTKQGKKAKGRKKKEGKDRKIHHAGIMLGDEDKGVT